MYHRVLPIGFLLALAIPHTDAWGWQGHGITGNLAQSILTPHANEVVELLLPGFTKGKLGNAASWADRIKKQPQYQWTKILHYINPKDTPPTYCGYDKQRDCPGECISTGIMNLTQVLENNWRDAVKDIKEGKITYLSRYSAERNFKPVKEGSKKHKKNGTDAFSFSEKITENGLSKKPGNPPQERLTVVQEALMLVVHAIGDVHQPLHATGRDRGGNNAPVKYNGRKGNLHAVWDTRLILTRKTEFPNYMTYLEEALNNTVAASCASNYTATQQPQQVKQEGSQIIFGAEGASSGNVTYVCPDDWITESNRINCDAVWKDFTYGMEAGTTYYEANKEVVELQLLRAGARIAAVLNQIFVE